MKSVLHACFVLVAALICAATVSAGTPGVGTYVPDFDQDGVRDSVLREVRLHPTELVASRVRVVSGASGTNLVEFVSPIPGDATGWDVVLIPDIDGDASPDLVLAAPNFEVDADRRYGKIYAIGSLSGNVLWANETPESSEPATVTFGAATVRAGAHALGRVGDLNQDGLPDVVIQGSSTPLGIDPTDPATPRVAWWAAFSAATGELLAEAHGPITESGLPGVDGLAEPDFWRQFSVPGTFEVLGGDPSDANADGWVDSADLSPLVATSRARGAGDLETLTRFIQSAGRVAPRRFDLFQTAEHVGTTHRRALPRHWACCICSELCEDNDEVPCGIDCEGCNTPCCADPCSCSSDPCCGDPCCGSSDPCCGSTDPCCGSPDPCCGNPDPCCIDPCQLGCRDECDPSCDSDDDGDPNSIDCDSSCPPPVARGGDEATIDLRVDCNNDGLINAIDDDNEDLWPHHKLIVVNRFDTDNDQVPDFADGYGGFGPTTAEPTVGNRFTPLKLKVNVPSDVEGAAVVFLFAGAHFDEVQREVVPIPELETEAEFFTFAPRPQCAIRLWTKDGDKPRTVADSIASGQPIPVSEGCWSTLFIEVVEGDWNRSQIIAQVIDGTGTVLASDEVDILPFDPAIGLGSNIEIAGYEIIRDSGLGTDGKDIIFAPTAELVVDAGAGDDIVVVGPGDQTIAGGTGSDRIFVSRDGHKYIDYELSTYSPLRQEPAADTVEATEPAPLTVDAAINAYKKIYGENDPWLRLYLEAGGRIEVVENDGVLFSQSDWDCHFNGTRLEYVVQIEIDLEEPFVAAGHLRAQILDCCKSDIPCGLSNRIRGLLMDDLWRAAAAQLHDDFDQASTTYDELVEAALQEAVEISAAIADVYVSSVGILSEGADVVISVNAIASGQYSAAIGLVPLVPSPVASSVAKVVAKTPSGHVFLKKVKDALYASGPLGVIQRRGMAVEEVHVVDGVPRYIYGTAQSTGNPLHAALINEKARELLLGDGVEYIVLNRSLRTATGYDADEIYMVVNGVKVDISRRRPDIIVVRLEGGVQKIDMYEIVSDSNGSVSEVRATLRLWRDAFPEQHRGNFDAFELPEP